MRTYNVSMSKRTIAEFSGLVIWLACSALITGSCSHASSHNRHVNDSAEFSAGYNKPVVMGEIESKEITESSGLAASRCQTDVLWTHNDSGNDADIFAITPKGKTLGTWRVKNAQNVDWEDIADYKDASGKCYLYIGDIGDNKSGRPDRTIYRVMEPTISSALSDDGALPLTEPADAVTFKYPDGPHNAETLLVHPTTGEIYVLTKRIDGPSSVFKIPAQFGSVVNAQKIAEVTVPSVPNGLLTGGSVSPDGRRVFLCDYTAGYELQLGDDPDFDDVFKSKPIPVDLGEREQGEGVTYSSDGSAIFASSEKRHSPVIEVTRK